MLDVCPGMTSKSWRWNGKKFVEAKSVPLSDRGFRYGMSLFESLRVINGQPEFFEKHLARLISACAEFDFNIAESAVRPAETLLASAGMDGFARIYVTAGDGAPDAAASSPRIYVFIEERALPTDECFEVTISDESYRPNFGGLKTANYWFNTAALTRARSRSFDEALLFNDFAELVSACCANVFVVRDDRIATPPRSSGARQGVIREWVIARRKVEERRLRREDVVNADEIFLTNSWLGVMPVATVEGRPLGRRTIGPKLAAELENRRGT
jgi:branched-subunit amino acid aminotransferase/4-amino-4-deoxychorismate lyase